MMITVMALYMTLKDFNSVNIVGVLRGGGDVRAATLIDIGPLWTCAIPYAAICGLVLRLPVLWVYLAFPLEQVIKCSMGISRLRSGKWDERRHGGPSAGKSTGLKQNIKLAMPKLFCKGSLGIVLFKINS